MRSNQLGDRLRLASAAAYVKVDDEQDRTRAARELLRLFGDIQGFFTPGTFLEVGAFDASFSREMRAAHPQSRVVAFEANPFNHRYWCDRVAFAQQGVEYLHFAVTDTDGPITFKVQSRWEGVDAPQMKTNDSLLIRNREGVEYEEVTVQGVTLDSFTADDIKAGHDFALWVDVEGAAEKALGGARKTLASTKSILIEVETYPYWGGQWLFPDVHSFLAENGFHPLARDFESHHQFNVIFVHESIADHHMLNYAFVNYMHRLGAGAETSPR